VLRVRRRRVGGRLREGAQPAPQFPGIDRRLFEYLFE
jgi:hypothetical protein